VAASPRSRPGDFLRRLAEQSKRATAQRPRHPSDMPPACSWLHRFGRGMPNVPRERLEEMVEPSQRRSRALTLKDLYRRRFLAAFFRFALPPRFARALGRFLPACFLSLRLDSFLRFFPVFPRV